MPAQDIQLSPENTYKMIPSFSGGINSFKSPLAIDPEEVSAASNVFSQKYQVRSDTGFSAFQNVVRGVPRKPYQFRKVNGTRELLLITDWSLFRQLGGEWRLVEKTGTASTTLSVNWTTGATITCTSITGVAVGDAVQVALDDGSYTHDVVLSLPGGNQVTLTTGFVSTATAGNAVIFGTVLAGDADSQVSVVTLPSQDWVVFTNGIDPVQKYDGSVLAPLGGLSTINVDTCIGLVAFFSYLLLLGPTVSGTIQPQTVRWCDTGAYEIWNSGNASFDTLVDTEGHIVAGSKLGPYVVIYKDDSIARGEFINQENRIFEFNTIVSGEGLAAHDMLIPLRNVHYFFGQNGIYEYLGDFTITPISNNVYFDIFGVQGDLDPTNKTRGFGRYVRELNELWWFYPTTGDDFPTRLVRMRVDTKAFWFRNFPAALSGVGFFQLSSSQPWSTTPGTWAQQTQRWSSNSILANAPTSLLCGQTALQVYEYDYLSVTDAGTAIAWEFTTKDFYHPNYAFRVSMLELLAAGGALLIEYSVDRGQTWNEFKSLTLAASSARKQIYPDNEFVTNSVRWRFSGTGPGFVMDYAGFHYQLETTQDLDAAV